MFRAGMFFLMTSALSAGAWADHCKKGDLSGCAQALRKITAQKGYDKKLAKNYDEICAENAKFKCVKKIVRGDMNEEMKYTSADYPKAHLFSVHLENESYIYILDSKP